MNTNRRTTSIPLHRPLLLAALLLTLPLAATAQSAPASGSTPSMDMSSMPGMDHGSMPGMTMPATASGTRKPATKASVNKAKKKHVPAPPKPSPSDMGDMKGMDHSTMPGMDYSTMPGMDHGSMSGILKNFLDHFWKEFAGKTFGIVCASHEKGLTAMDQVRTAIRQCYGWALPYGVSLSAQDVDENGVIGSEKIVQRLQMLGRDLVVYGSLIKEQRRIDLESTANDTFIARYRPVQ